MTDSDFSEHDDASETGERADLTDVPMPEQIGPYRLERALGSGGMGTVYFGRHVDSDEPAAIKVLPASMAREPGFVARFNREVEAMKQLKSPHIVELFESGEDHGTYYYAMEYVPGETLTQRLYREKRLPWREVIEIGVQVCKALKAAHNCGIIHRDLKPSNLMLREDGTVKLSDFGIAQVFASSKLTVTGGILGTAEYMSPEQAQGKRATKQSDLYSLGAVLYVMLTGRPPFTGKTTLDLAQKHRFAQFDSPRRVVPEIPVWLDEVVCQCLSKKPEDRYPDAYVLMLRLQEIPKKVDLRTSGTFEFDDASPTRETQADGGAAQSVRSGEVGGGTIARDLFRAQVEAERVPTTVWGRLFDNVWVLVGLLALLLIGVFAIARSQQLSPEEMFQRGEELMAGREGSGWETARREYFLPLLKLDREKWEPQVEPYLDQIEQWELKRDLLGRPRLFRSTAESRNEPEAIIRQAMELQDEGRLAEAREKLMALETVLEGQEQYASVREIATQLRKELGEQLTADRLDYLKAALARADELESAGREPQARAIWRSIASLYHADPDASAIVEQAQQKLDSLTSDSRDDESNTTPGSTD